MNRKIFSLKKLILLLFILTTLLSCTNEPNIGFDVLPSKDSVKLTTVDTFSLFVKTIREDSVVGSGATFNMAGSYIDPIFGYSQSDFIFQMLPTTYVATIKPATVDSIILYLRYAKDTVVCYGNKDKAQTLSVYRMNKSISTYNNYYSNKNIDDYKAELLGSILYKPFKTATDTILAIKLDKNFANDLVDINDLGSVVGSQFFDYVKGIAIKSDGQNAAIVKFNLTSASSKIRLYYSKTANDSLYLDYTFGTGCQTVNFFKHDYSSSKFNNIINQPVQDTVAYLQTMSGLKVKVEIPNLYTLRNLGKIVIVNAELIVKLENSATSLEASYQSSDRLFIAGLDKDEYYSLLPEYYGSNGYSPEYLNTKKEYHFNLTKYVQQLINGKSTFNNLIVYSYRSNSDFSRTVITTGKNSKKMKFLITYYKL